MRGVGGSRWGAEVPQRRARCYNKEKRRRRNGISGEGAVRGITTNTGRKVSSSPGPRNAKSRDGEEEKHSAKWRERRKEPVHAVRPCARACPRVCARARVCVRASVQGVAKTATGAQAAGPWRGAARPVRAELERRPLSAGVLQAAGAATPSPGYSSKFSKMSLNKDLVRVWGRGSRS